MLAEGDHGKASRDVCAAGVYETARAVGRKLGERRAPAVQGKNDAAASGIGNSTGALPAGRAPADGAETVDNRQTRKRTA